MRRARLFSYICPARACMNAVHARKRGLLCSTCKRKQAKKRAAERRRALKSDRKARADLKRASLARRVASWQTKLKRATNGLKKAQRQLRAFEKRYTWNNFIGWDKSVPMPRLTDQAQAVSQSDENIDGTSSTTIN